MSLSIEIRKVGHVIVMDLAGRVSVLDPLVKQLAGELIERGERFFIINLANVSYLDNAGLGQLCWVYTVVRNRRGDMKLLRPPSRVRKLLNITKLDTVFESFEFESDAMESMPLLTSSISA